MPDSSSSSRRTKPAASSAQGTSVVPPIETDAPYADLSDVTSAVDVAAMPVRPNNYIPELEAPAENGGRQRYNQPYVNPIMPFLRRLRRQLPAEIPENEMDALMRFMGDDTGEVRVNSIFLSEAATFLACELFERYSRTALTLAIYLGKNGGTGVSAAKRDISRSAGVNIGESDPVNGFPRHLGLRYTVQQLIDAVNFLNEAYGENGTIAPGAITAANEVLKAKSEAAGRTYRN